MSPATPLLRQLRSFDTVIPSPSAQTHSVCRDHEVGQRACPGIDQVRGTSKRRTPAIILPPYFLHINKHQSPCSAARCSRQWASWIGGSLPAPNMATCRSTISSAVLPVMTPPAHQQDCVDWPEQEHICESHENTPAEPSLRSGIRHGRCRPAACPECLAWQQSDFGAILSTRTRSPYHPCRHPASPLRPSVSRRPWPRW